jgi:GNAT superfamily N-acetyltransferase
MPEIAWLDDLPAAALERVRAIYEEAFPPRQRVPFEELVDDARGGDELALIGLEDGRPMGIAFLSRLHAVGHLFLEYYAVASDLRGGGRGQALWRAVHDELRREAPRPVVLEVEDPAEPQIEPDEARARARRVRFWEHVGAIALPLDGYVIPDVGGDGVEPMRLMWVAACPGDRSPRDRELLDLVLALYASGYGLGSDDELVQRAQRMWG